jgi:LmbE family N-acetylglucosaminyl deacetylase
MPVLHQNGAMTIVAHIDDDLLFMNPDIASSIAAGEGSTSVFVTAGDAGGEDWYWQGREEGAKAAYSLMAGAEDWVDEVLAIQQAGETYDVASSYLESAPEVRLYFLRIPDGAGAIADPADYESLARLEDGTRATVDTVDGAATYTRSDLVDVLTGVMEAHDPHEFRLQVAEGSFATGEHTDHVHATEFALEALAGFSGTDYQVSHYVNYQSDQLAPNLSDEDAAFSLEVMEAYAAHDPGATDENGVLLPVYVEWSGRQYIAETYGAAELEGGPPATEDPAPDPGPVAAPPETGGDGAPVGQVTYSLGDDPDNFLFDVNPETGDITPRDWFSPSLDDAWDIDEDYIYDVTLISTPHDGGEATSQLVQFDTEAEGVLSLIGGPTGAEDTASEAPGVTEDGIPSPVDAPTVDPAEPAPVDDPAPVEVASPPLAGLTYDLSGPDAFLFEIEGDTGAIATKDWFVPSHDDAWDQDENHIYDLTRTGTDDGGNVATRQFLSYEVTPDDALTLFSVTDDLLLALEDTGTEAEIALLDEGALEEEDLVDA